MRFFTLVLCLSQFVVAIAPDSSNYVGFVTKVKGKSKEDVESRREEIIVKLNRESETIITDAITGDGVDVLYNDTLIVHGRNYTFTAHPGECTFGSLLSKDDKEVYLYERDLTADENNAYLNERDSYPKALPDARTGDIIIPTFTTDENGEKKRNKNKFALVRLISNVAYACETNTFCCGLSCCPTALKQFLTKIKEGDKRYEMVVPVDSEQDVLLHLMPQPISNSSRHCGYIIDSFDYYPHFKDSEIDAIRYKCPKNYFCCADTLCCKVPAPHVKEESFGTWIAGFKGVLIALFIICGLLFVAGMWYWCHYKRSSRPPPHTYLAPVKRGSRYSNPRRTSEMM